MSEPNKSKSTNWLSVITDDVLFRVGSPVAGHVETHGPGGGFSVCTERHPGAEPPGDAITAITRIR
jgi:hypothetical protein